MRTIASLLSRHQHDDVIGVDSTHGMPPTVSHFTAEAR